MLRFIVAGTLLFYTFVSLSNLVRSTFHGWLIGVISLIFSATMASGFLTPVISALIFIAGILFLILSPGERWSALVIYLVVLSLVTALLGPGAYSIDANIFGRREIILSKKN